MESTGRRNKNVDYRLLAGVSKRKEDMDKKLTKSGRSNKSAKNKDGKTEVVCGEGKEDWLQKAEVLDKELEDMMEKIENEPAYLAMLEEQASKKMGDVFEMEGPLPDDLHDDKVFARTEAMHKEELELMRKRKLQLERRKKMLDIRDELMEQRMQLEVMLTEQWLQEKKSILRTKQALFKLKLKEQAQTEKEQAFQAKCDRMIKGSSRASHITDEEETRLIKERTEQWVRASVVQLDVRPKEKITSREKTPSCTGCQISIMELEAKLQETQQLLQAQQEAWVTSNIPGRITHLKRIGLMPHNTMVGQDVMPPMEAEKKKMNLGTGEQPGGKQDEFILQNFEASCTQDKGRIKSGKYVKSNIDLKIQEQWPHLNVMRKYAKRTTFEQMDYETFIAGEVKIILNMEDRLAAKGRLEFLCKVAHWMCKARDWNNIKSLYEAVLESIELGEEDWHSDFSHYETMVVQGIQVDAKDREAKIK